MQLFTIKSNCPLLLILCSYVLFLFCSLGISFFTSDQPKSPYKIRTDFTLGGSVIGIGYQAVKEEGGIGYEAVEEAVREVACAMQALGDLCLIGCAWKGYGGAFA